MIKTVLEIPGIKEKIIPLINFSAIQQNLRDLELTSNNLSINEYLFRIKEITVDGFTLVLTKKPRILKESIQEWIDSKRFPGQKEMIIKSHLFTSWTQLIHKATWNTNGTTARKYSRNDKVLWRNVSEGFRERVHRNTMRAVMEILLLGLFECPMPCPNCKDGRISNVWHRYHYGSNAYTTDPAEPTICPYCGFRELNGDYRDRIFTGIIEAIIKNINIITGEETPVNEEQEIVLNSISIEL